MQANRFSYYWLDTWVLANVIQLATQDFCARSTKKIFSPPLAPYQINPLSLQSDEVPKQTIGKDYLHGINRFLHFEFPTLSYWRSNYWPSFFCSKATIKHIRLCQFH